MSIPADLFNKWVSEPEIVCKEDFQEIVRISVQKVADIAEKAMCYGAELELEQCCEYLSNYYDPAISAKLRHNREAAVLSLKQRALLALNDLDSLSRDPAKVDLLRIALLSPPD